MPLLYRPEVRRQDIMVTIPGPLLLDGRPDQRDLVLNDVEVALNYAREVLGGEWGSDWAHNPRSSKSLDRRRLPAVVQSRIFGCVEG